MALLNNCSQSSLLLLLIREHRLVDRCLAEDAQFCIDSVATVDEVADIFGCSLSGGLVEILKDTPRILVFANFKWLLWEGRGVGLRAELGQEAGRLVVPKVGGDVQWRVVVLVLLI